MHKFIFLPPILSDLESGGKSFSFNTDVRQTPGLDPTNNIFPEFGSKIQGRYIGPKPDNRINNKQ